MIRSVLPVRRRAFGLAITVGVFAADVIASPLNKLTYHNNSQRSGWNPHEDQLTPTTVSPDTFGQLR